MGRVLFLAAFLMALVCALLVIRTRSQIIATGNRIVTLQKELWELREMNAKLKLEYDRIVTAENIIRKNAELNLSLVPPREVVCVPSERPVVSMQAAGAGGRVE